jgi:diguanylate cyclase (GGDEF)-like protein
MSGHELAPARSANTREVERLGSLRPASRLFIVGVIAAGALVSALAMTEARFERPALFVQMLALALLTASVKLPLPLSRSVSTLSVSNTLTFASMVLLDVGSTVLIGVLAAWGQCTFRIRTRNPLHRTLFSMAVVGLAAYAATLVFDWLVGVRVAATSGVSRGTLFAMLDLVDVLRAIIPGSVVYFAVNTVLVAMVVALTSRQPIHRVWLDSYIWSAPGYFVAAAVGCAALFLDYSSHVWGGLIAVPLYLTYRSYQSFIARIEEERAQVRQLSDVQLATIEALAQAIEVKDHTSHGHIQAFQVYAEGLSRAVGASDEEIRAIKTAALLHDIGNLAVPEYILGKPGVLTPEEFSKLQTHTQVGANIVASVPFPYPVAPLILAHHEHWDGSGYPHALRGEAIPRGARVLRVVDFFTALLADRPYREAHDYPEATVLLREHAGSTLDPTLVETFISILPALEDTLGRLKQSRGTSPLEAAPAQAEREALQDIAGAQREAKVFHEIAQALGSSLRVDDTFNLIANNVRVLLAYSTCALFLADELGRLRCSRISGRGDVDAVPVPRLDMENLRTATMGPMAAPVAPGQTWGDHLVAPLRLGNVLIGALVVYHDDASFYGAEHRRLLDLMARQAAPVVHNALVFERTQEASLTDPLTGLSNRRALQQQAAARLATVSPGSHSAVLLFDLDNLKHLNDTFGHHVGDMAIREVARVFESMRRRGDLCARYAGDEFVLVLWDCDAAEAGTRARALQDAVSAVRLELGAGEAMPLSVSVGAAVSPADGTTVEALIAVADQRMYRDKVQRKRQLKRKAAGRDAA